MPQIVEPHPRETGCPQQTLKARARWDTDMQLSELTVLVLPGEPVWLCADDPPMMHGEDASGMWIGLPIEEAWALVDRLRAELPPRPVAEVGSTQPASEGT